MSSISTPFTVQSTYGFRSCIMEGLDFIIPRLVIGVIVQVLCSYSTLPLYALVTQVKLSCTRTFSRLIFHQICLSWCFEIILVLKMQMGSMFKQTIFDEFTQNLILTWAKDRKFASEASESMSNRLTTESANPSICLAQPPEGDDGITPSEIELSCPDISYMPSSCNKY